jgi:transposase
MLAIEKINDISQLRQVAVLLDRENARLIKRLEELARRIAALEGGEGTQELLAELAELERQNDALKRKLFAASSERRKGAHDDGAPAPRPKRKGHGPREQPRLPVVEVKHDLPDGTAGMCTTCEGVIGEWKNQSEDSELITVVRRHFKVEQHRRQKYRCQCGDSIVTAPGPPRLIEGGRYSVEFGVDVAMSKYLDHLPLDRQRHMMRREGLDVTTATLWDQVEAVASCLRPAWKGIKDQILAEPLIHADETRWRLIVAPKSENWMAWAIASPRAVYYEALPSRSAETGSSLLGEYGGVVMVDGYAAYPAIARGSPGMSLVHCWAHVRRGFIEIEHHYPVECATILALIAKLYAVEKDLPALPAPGASDYERVLAMRVGERRERSAPVLAEILTWVGGLRLTPKSALRQAVEYMTGRWKGLTRFIDDGRVPLDNNLIERSLRPVALGRKTHLGSKSPRGIEAMGILYTVIETCKLQGVDPRTYVLQAVLASLESPRRLLLPSDLRA